MLKVATTKMKFFNLHLIKKMLPSIIQIDSFQVNGNFIKKMQLQKYVKRKYCLLAIILLILFFYAYVRNVENSPQPNFFRKISVKRTKVNLKHVLVHIDLKRTPLRLSYLKQLLIILKRLGATGLLMEYEDMFPYEGELIVLKNKNSYTKEELMDFLETSKNLSLEILPFVQTFGHLQFVLQYEKFRHLREKNYIDSICPSKPGSIYLIHDMLSQVIRFHESVVPVQHIHIGCDEVYHMNLCRECKIRQQSNSTIYIQHIHTVISMVENISEHTNVLIWDDMLRTIPFFPKNITAEPVIWNYEQNIKFSLQNLSKYHKIFPNIWIASAFKGADGNTNVLPNINNRFLNNYLWLNEIRDYKLEGESKVFNFEGIILTGWSRYQYDQPTVDILPASLPSLILNLLLVSRFKSGYIIDSPKKPIMFYAKYLRKLFLTLLDCNIVDGKINPKSKNILNYDQLFRGNCNFSEWKMYKGILEYLELYSYVNIITYQYSTLDREICDQVSDEINESNSTLLHVMNQYYAADFVTEYVNILIQRLKKLVKCSRYLGSNPN